MTGVQDPKLPQGYSFDYINGEVIKTRLSVNNGKLVLPDGMKYSVLVLPQLKTIRPELLLKIKELVTQGAVVLGPRPLTSPSLQNYPAADKQVTQLAKELWGNINGTTVRINRLGKGLVISNMDLQEVLDLVKVKPDVKIAGDSALFIHRVLPDGDVYFISNQKNKAVKLSPEFRTTGKQPELWDAVNGSRRDMPNFTQTAGSTTVPLQLAPLESAFIIFRNTAGAQQSKLRISNYPASVMTVAIDKPWSVQFDNKMRGPAQPVIFKKLTDWSVDPNDSIRYYSGSAVYHNSFVIDKVNSGKQVFLDLGMATAIAKVSVNGIAVGGVWTAPYKIDISKALKTGENAIEIKVVNTWVNRLVGDSKLPVTERKTWASINRFSPNSSLEKSGLLGPVTIYVYDKQK
jgi:hypothetical protein